MDGHTDVLVKNVLFEADSDPTSIPALLLSFPSSVKKERRSAGIDVALTLNFLLQHHLTVILNRELYNPNFITLTLNFLIHYNPKAKILNSI